MLASLRQLGLDSCPGVFVDAAVSEPGPEPRPESESVRRLRATAGAGDFERMRRVDKRLLVAFLPFGLWVPLVPAFGVGRGDLERDRAERCRRVAGILLLCGAEGHATILIHIGVGSYRCSRQFVGATTLHVQTLL